MSDGRIERLKARIRDVPDFPKPGILFRDMTPLLADPVAFGTTLDLLTERLSQHPADVVVGIESRGFIFGAPLADRLRKPFVPVRKPGKLPYKKAREEFALEYGTDALEIHEDAIAAGQRVIILDDLLATGGTAEAAAKLVAGRGGLISAFAFVVELKFLRGAARLAPTPIVTLIDY